MKSKFKNYSFWVALSGAIIVLVQAVGKLCGFIPDATVINEIIMGIAGLLVVFGVVSSPEKDSSENFSQNEDKEKVQESDEKASESKDKETTKEDEDIINK